MAASIFATTTDWPWWPGRVNWDVQTGSDRFETSLSGLVVEVPYRHQKLLIAPVLATAIGSSSRPVVGHLKECLK
jgi:hypothetical protein